MEAAANEVIALLGIEDHQIAIYCHRDRPHPHIHLLINRVHPENGKTATFSNAHRKLDKWANQYEMRCGNIVTKKRAAKFRRMAKAKEIWPDDAERRAYVEQKREEAAERSPNRPKNERWDKLKAAQLRADERQSTIMEQQSTTDIVLVDPPPLPSQVPTERRSAAKEANRGERENERRQEAQRRAQAAEERKKDREARQQAERVHKERMDAEKQAPEAEIFDALFCAFEREQVMQGIHRGLTRNHALEWYMALALRALDKQQPELRLLLSERFKLPVGDPVAFRTAITSKTKVEGIELVDAVDDLDGRMDKEPDRSWKKRRLAFHEMIDFYGQQRVLNHDGDSPQHIFRTTIKSICEHSGLADFYRNTLKPLVNRLVDAVRSKQAFELSKHDSVVSTNPKGSDLGR